MKIKFSILFLILFLNLSSVLAQISDKRQKQLDSIVTNIEKSRMRNLDSLHLYIHNSGISNEERVFMFYGLISIHYKYDFERMKQKSKESVEYTPYYTAYRRKGVCRDFSALFKELCLRSDIPCVEVYGKVRNPIFFEGLIKFFTFKLKYSNHAWNLVQYNGTWHNMDPTWSHIKSVSKYYEYKKNGEINYVAKVKRADRTYYDISYEKMYSGRKASHPVFYAQDTVFTYKTVKRKESKRKILYTDYDFSSQLDSFLLNPNFIYNPEYYRETYLYSKNHTYIYNLFYQFDFLKIKRTKYNPITPELCDRHLEELKKLLKYIEKHYGRTYKKKYSEHEIAVLKYKNRLLKKRKR